MPRLVLTITQARNLQQSPDPWPADWAFLTDIPVPEKPDTKADPHRMVAGLKMLALGCTDEQIEAQLGWIADSSPCRQLHRLHKRGIRPA